MRDVNNISNYFFSIYKVKLATNNYTEKIYFSKGVIQGDSCSPLGWSLYIANLAKALQRTEVGIKLGKVIVSSLLFADDVGLISRTARKGINHLFNVVNSYNKAYDMNLSMKKTYIITSSKTINSWKVGPTGETITELLTAKYLGIDISLNNKFITRNREDSVIREARAKAQTIQGLTRSGLDRSKLTKELWEKCAVPAILYCSEVLIFSKRSIQKLETIQNQVGKFMLQIPSSSANIMVWTDAGMIPMYGRIMIRQACYYWKLNNSQHDSILNQCFQEEKSDPTDPWTNHIKSIIEQYERRCRYNTNYFTK